MKNIIIKKSIYLLFVALATGLFTACDENIHDFAKRTGSDAANSIYIANTVFDFPVNRTANAEVIGLDTILAKFPVHAVSPVEVDMTVTLAIDYDLVTVYNLQHGTNYSFLPGSKLDRKTVTIGKGQTLSVDSVVVTYIGKLPDLSNRNGYLLPVRISRHGGSDVKVNYEERVSYLVINVTQQNGIGFEETSGKITNNPALDLFDGSFDGMKFRLLSLFGTAEDTKVTLTVNNSLIPDYNASMGTDYQAVSASDFESVEVTFAGGAASAEGVLSYKGDISALKDLRGYVVPFEISSVTGTGIDKINAKKVFYAILDISNLYSTVVADPAELGTKVTDRTKYELKKFNFVATGNPATPSNGAAAAVNMFTDNNAQYWVVQKTGAIPHAIDLDITIDLGEEVQNISGLWMEGFQSNASFNMKAVDVYYATQQAYANGQSDLVGKISFDPARQMMYIKFSEPITARYIMLNNMVPQGVMLALRQFYICTGN
ncbi:BT_3987 domain-containing protein [Dysgonomonas sp.]